MSFSNLAVSFKAAVGTSHKRVSYLPDAASADRLQCVCKGIKGSYVTWEFLSDRESLSSD